MSDEERNALEEGKFEVDELDDSQLEEVAGGEATNNCTNGSQCQCPTVSPTFT